MSSQSWLEEFYPIPVDSLDKDKLSKLDALEHSLRKWEGIREKNLKKHNIRTKHRDLLSNSHCAMCLKYYDDDETLESGYIGKHKCENCPIYKNNGGKGCSYDPNNRSEFYLYLTSGNPLPMIKTLKKLIKAEKNHEKNDKISK